MGLWLPPEILTRITSYISDVSDLLSLRTVNHDWSKAADTELERWACLSIDPKSINKFEDRYKKIAVRKRITDVAIIVPDRDYWHKRDANSGAVIVMDPVSFAYPERLRLTLRKKVHLLPNLARLSFHIRPPRQELGPILTSPAIERSRTLADTLGALVDILRRISGRRVVNRTLKELSIQSLPAQIGFASSVRDWNDTAYQIERILRRLDLHSLKLGIISPTVWQPENAQPTNPPTWMPSNHFDDPDIWLKGLVHSLRHLSITCWGFYIKHITGSEYTHVIPQLESLELRGCAFTSDQQVNWLLRHRKLRSLVLDDCAIVYKLHLRDRNPQIEDCASVDLVIEQGGAMQEYQATWSQFFSRLTSLTEIRHFKFGSSRVRQRGEEGPVFESEHRVGPPLGQSSAKFLLGLFPDRYLHLANGTASCEWVLRPPRGSVIRPYWVTTSQASDRDALVSLLKGLGQDIKWNDTSDHAGYVRDLIGMVKQKPRPTTRQSKGSSTKDSKSFSTKSSSSRYSKRPSK